MTNTSIIHNLHIVKLHRFVKIDGQRWKCLTYNKASYYDEGIVTPKRDGELGNLKAKLGLYFYYQNLCNKSI
jgi:hypothetical protein